MADERAQNIQILLDIGLARNRNQAIESLRLAGGVMDTAATLLMRGEVPENVELFVVAGGEEERRRAEFLTNLQLMYIPEQGDPDYAVFSRLSDVERARRLSEVDVKLDKLRSDLEADRSLANVADENGSIPLSVACNYACREVVELLLSFGADTNMKNKHGKTFRQCVRRPAMLDVVNAWVVRWGSRPVVTAGKAPQTFGCDICISYDLEVGKDSLVYPCGHCFCFGCTQAQIKIAVRERKLEQLVCPTCQTSLMTPQYFFYFQELLDRDEYSKLNEWLLKESEFSVECPQCGDVIWTSHVQRNKPEGRDLRCPNDHHFCGFCKKAAHPNETCEQAAARLAEANREAERQAQLGIMEAGAKPCPARCIHGLQFKQEAECDHATCPCGFEFCWECGVDRRLLIAHDNRWHKPHCKYWDNPQEVQEEPRASNSCPACRANGGACCAYPAADGWPRSYV
mmetsp:Transcript_81807/g.227825  ORF Transcript_81807/g.227825 Transcript_81807/m.227825 type:complete len:457 (-) Transcript_81807:120-1490(-)